MCEFALTPSDIQTQFVPRRKHIPSPFLFTVIIVAYSERGRERERGEKKEVGEVLSDTIFGGSKKESIYISGLEGSQAVPARPSGRGISFFLIIFFKYNAGRAALL
jgi:hypothetical protein